MLGEICICLTLDAGCLRLWFSASLFCVSQVVIMALAIDL